MPSSLSPEPVGNITYPTPETEKPQPYYIAHPEAVAALDKAPAKVAAAQAAGSGYSTYVVKPGESLSKIAVAHGFRTADIVAVNPGLDANKIRAGQTIVLPGAGSAKPAVKTYAAPAKTASAGGTYVVQKGDILGRIANKHGVKLADLKKANGLTSDKIVVGQKLVIPGAKAEAKPAAAVATVKPPKLVAAEPKPQPAKTPAQANVVTPTPAAPAVKTVEPPAIVPPTPPTIVDPPAPPPPEAPKGTPYIVQEGQDLFDISVKWGVSAAEIKSFNHLDSDKVVPGQTILIPPPKVD
jgi:LysM repeat protein